MLCDNSAFTRGVKQVSITHFLHLSCHVLNSDCLRFVNIDVVCFACAYGFKGLKKKKN